MEGHLLAIKEREIGRKEGQLVHHPSIDKGLGVADCSVHLDPVGRIGREGGGWFETSTCFCPGVSVN